MTNVSVTFSVTGFPFHNALLAPAYLPIYEGYDCAPQGPYALFKLIGEGILSASVRRGALAATSLRMPWIRTPETFQRHVGPPLHDNAAARDLWSYIDARDAGTRGSIVHMSSSMAGQDVLSGAAGHAATKHGVLDLTWIAALDAAQYGLLVNAFCPGVIDTSLGVTSGAGGGGHFADRTPLRRIGQPQDVAPLVAFLASADAAHVTGAAWLIDGGQTRQSWSSAPAAESYPWTAR